MSKNGNEVGIVQKDFFQDVRQCKGDEDQEGSEDR